MEVVRTHDSLDSAELHVLSDSIAYREMAAFAQFGSDLDATTQRLLNRSARLTELLKQPQFKPRKVEEQVVVIYAGVNGYVDPIPIKDVQRFESELLRFMRAEHQDVLDDIRDKREISKETGDKLKVTVDKFARETILRELPTE